jgi:hypothetical protein
MSYYIFLMLHENGNHKEYLVLSTPDFLGPCEFTANDCLIQFLSTGLFLPHLQFILLLNKWKKVSF